jgi:hypothetical protein
MPWEDPIVEEVRQARDAYAKRFNYDLDAIYRDLKEKERRSGHVIVPCPNKQEAAGSSEETHPRESA